MSFKPNLPKQAQEIVFCQKLHNISHPKVNFNNSPVLQSTYQKFRWEVKVRLWPFKKIFHWLQWKPFKNDEKCFLDAQFQLDTVLWNHPGLSVSLSICPSVHLSIPPSLDIPKIGLLVFSDIVNDGSWPWYIVADEARFF